MYDSRIHLEMKHFFRRSSNDSATRLVARLPASVPAVVQRRHGKWRGKTAGMVVRMRVEHGRAPAASTHLALPVFPERIREHDGAVVARLLLLLHEEKPLVLPVLPLHPRISREKTASRPVVDILVMLQRQEPRVVVEVVPASAATAVAGRAARGAAVGPGLDVLRGRGEADAHVVAGAVGAQVGVVVAVVVAADGEHGVLGLVAPAGDGLDVALGERVEDLGDVEVLLDRRAEELEAGVAGELLNLVTKRIK